MTDDPTLVWRVPIGVSVLLALAVRDRLRTGTWDRARELAVLFGITLVALVYALVHDAITWSISRDYFAIGKDLPAAARSFAPVVPLALEAGWTAGLAIGLALVVSNNPAPSLPRLGERALVDRALGVAAAAGCTALAGGLAGPTLLGDWAPDLASAGIADPRAFLIAQGAHLGSYAGGAAATLLAALEIRRTRRSSRHPSVTGAGT